MSIRRARSQYETASIDSTSQKHGCELVREGRKHSIWNNVELNLSAAVPRYTEIANQLAKAICEELGIPTL